MKNIDTWNGNEKYASKNLTYNSSQWNMLLWKQSMPQKTRFLGQQEQTGQH